MNKKLILAGLIFFLVLSTTFFLRINQNGFQFDEDNVIPTSQNGSLSQNQVPDSTSGKVTVEQLAQHNSKSDCWVAYAGKVYDITSFLPYHPGGINRIAPYCGTSNEFQNAFTQQHGTRKVSLLMTVGTFMGDFEAKGNLA